MSSRDGLADCPGWPWPWCADGGCFPVAAAVTAAPPLRGSRGSALVSRTWTGARRGRRRRSASSASAGSCRSRTPQRAPAPRLPSRPPQASARRIRMRRRRPAARGPFERGDSLLHVRRNFRYGLRNGRAGRELGRAGGVPASDQGGRADLLAPLRRARRKRDRTRRAAAWRVCIRGSRLEEGPRRAFGLSAASIPAQLCGARAQVIAAARCRGSGALEACSARVEG
jgi:hypothetical protein